ncbi:MAG TPA: GNAT family N-acetyltransferase [Vicinamibacterales bacterium]|nr:GNAT family N-acetyltransferase [Vicinamibacterales bacterium]
MRAGAEDIPELVRLINAAYEVEKFFVSGDRTDAATVRHLLTRGVFLVTREGDDISGCVYVELRGPRGYFGMLSVLPGRQGSGLGRRLVTLAEQHAREHGGRDMDIRVVNLRTELPPFYRRLGYEETGIEPAVEPRALRPFHFIVMSKRLV